MWTLDSRWSGVWPILALGWLSACSYPSGDRAAQPTVTVTVLEPKQDALPENLFRADPPNREPELPESVAEPASDPPPEPVGPGPVPIAPGAFEGVVTATNRPASNVRSVPDSPGIAIPPGWFPVQPEATAEPEPVPNADLNPDRTAIPRPVAVEAVLGSDPRRLD